MVKEKTIKCYSLSHCFSKTEEALAALILLSDLFAKTCWEVGIVDGAIRIWVVGFLERDSTCSSLDAMKIANMGMSFRELDVDVNAVGFSERHKMNLFGSRFVSNKSRDDAFMKEITTQLEMNASPELQFAERPMGVVF